MADENTVNYSFTKPEPGASEDSWGDKLNANWDDVDGRLGGDTQIAPDLVGGSWKINGNAVTATADEINKLDGFTGTVDEINKLDGFTGTVDDLNYAGELRATGVTAAEFNTLDGFSGTVDDLNYAKDLRATGVTTTEFDKLDGLTATTAELNYVDGVTSNIQTQLDDVVTAASETVGVGQTWQDVSGSRSANTVYQNNTDKPIQWAVHGSSGKLAQVSSDGSTWVRVATLGAPGSFETAATPVIPVGHYYRTTGGFNVWSELR